MIANILDRRTDSVHSICDAIIDPAWKLNEIEKEASYLKDCDFESIRIEATKIANIIKTATDINGSVVVYFYDSYFSKTYEPNLVQEPIKPAEKPTEKTDELIKPSMVNTNDLYNTKKVF